MIDGFGLFFGLLFSLFQPASIAAVPTPLPPPPLPHIQVDHSYSAKSIILMDLASGERIIDYHTGDVLPIASISKIMAARVALEHLDPDEYVTFSREAINTEGVFGNFAIGETLRVRDLVSAGLMSSSNDAIMALAETTGERFGGKNYKEKIELFVSAMNEEAKSLGMTRSIFKNPTGLDNPGNYASNISTAEDLMRFMAASNDMPMLWELSRNSAKSVYSTTGQRHLLVNLNLLSKRLMYFVGGKTGSTDVARESVITIFEYPLGKKYGFALLNADPGKRFIEAEELLAQFAPMLP